MSRLKDAYNKLGLRYGASMEEVKKARRSLARQWHPDIYPDNQERELAENRIKQINAAYAYIKKINQYTPRTKARRTSTRDKNSNPQRRTGKKKQSGKTRTYSKSDKKKTTDGKQKKQQTHREKTENRSTREENNEQKGWWAVFKAKRKEKKRARRREKIRQMAEQRNADMENFDRTYRIGFRRSWFNNVLAKLFSRFSKDKQTNGDKGLTFFDSHRKQVQDLSYTLMKDELFYAINSGFNIVLKYVLGFLLGYEFLKNINVNYFHGVFYGNFSAFVWAELKILFLYLLLFLPDNIFQRYLLWRHRNITREQVGQLFGNKTLPPPYEEVKKRLWLVKYTSVAFFLWMYY